MPAESPPEPDPSPSGEGEPPFAGFDDAFNAPEDPGPGSGFDEPGAGGSLLDASLALGVARSWVKQHQTLTMLGAFATGVVLGSLLRD
ncbi:MAG: hypothetical protein ABEL97_08680 [Salinibacter sp.]